MEVLVDDAACWLAVTQPQHQQGACAASTFSPAHLLHTLHLLLLLCPCVCSCITHYTHTPAPLPPALTLMSRCMMFFSCK